MQKGLTGSSLCPTGVGYNRTLLGLRGLYGHGVQRRYDDFLKGGDNI